MSAVRYHARWVVPVASPPVEDGTVVVEGGVIRWVGPRAHAPAGRDEALGEVILLPGLVNAHTHLELTAMRGFLEGLPFFDWVRTLTRARREVLTDDDLRAAARLGVAEGLLHGVTTFADTGDSDGPLDALRELGARGIAYREVFGPAPEQCESALAGLDAKVRAMRGRATPLVRVGVSPHAPYSVGDALFTAVAAYARREGLPIAVHVAEGEDESALVTRAEGPFADLLRGRGIAVAPRAPSPMALLEATGVLGADLLCIHAVRCDDADIARAARAGAAIAHCPVSNAKLGHGVAPLAAWRRAGVRVGLGSDSMASNNAMDLLGEGRLAALLARATGGGTVELDAATVVALATHEGARALGLQQEVGTLEPGRRADLAAFPLDPARAPVHDPCDALVWGRPAVAAFVAVDGVPLVRAGRLVRHDLDALAAPVHAQAARLARWRAAAGG